MHIVSLMAACFWSYSPPSRMLILVGSSPRISRTCWSWFWSQSGRWYDRICSPWRFQSSIFSGVYLIMQRVSLILYCHCQPISATNAASLNGTAVAGLGGKM